MPDGTRCDCLTPTNAVEFDFGHKWAEAIGQALIYGAHTGRRPGIVLILEHPGDEKYLDRIETVRKAYGLSIDVWAVDRNGKELLFTKQY